MRKNQKEHDDREQFEWLDIIALIIAAFSMIGPAVLLFCTALLIILFAVKVF